MMRLPLSVLPANAHLPLTKAATASREHGLWDWKKYDRLRYRRYRAQPAQRGQVLDPLRPAGPELCWISAAKTQKWDNKPRQITHIKL